MKVGGVVAMLSIALWRIGTHGVLGGVAASVPDSKAAAVAAAPAVPIPAGEMRDALNGRGGEKITPITEGCVHVPRRGFGRVVFRGETEIVDRPWTERVCPGIPDARPGTIAGSERPFNFATVKRS